MTLILRYLKICALALAATPFAGNANAETLDAVTIQELLNNPAMLSNDELSKNYEAQAVQIQVMILVVFTPLEALIPGVVAKVTEISICESGLQQLWPDGSLKVNPDPDSSAAGAMQVLLDTHRTDYQRIGLDPSNAPDNILFSRYMVERKWRVGRENVFEDWVCA
jgi:hypothetical protein